MPTTIRPRQPGDADRLLDLHQPPLDPQARSRLLSAEHLWLIIHDGQPAGYATADSVPGLEGVVELSLYIAPAFRAEGLGSRLLAHAIAELSQAGAHQLSHPVADLDGPCARFLRRHGFAVEHQEWKMGLPALDAIAPVELPASYEVTTYPRRLTIQHLLHLSDESFRGLPWHQPFSHAEIVATLHQAGDALFLIHDDQPIGFVWTHFHPPDQGQIEPIGILPRYQGHGLGRQLLLAGLHHLRGRGARQVVLGVWQNNHVAIRLYQSLGFQHLSTLTYMALDISKK